MLNGVRSDGCSARLSATENPRYQRADVGDVHRRSRADLLLHRDAEIPVGRTDAPAVEDARIEVVGQDVLAEVRVRHDAAQIAAAGAEILRGRVQQIAVGHEVAVRVGPRPRHARRAEHRRRLRHSQRGIGVGVVARHAGALEVFAEADLERRPAGAEQVVARRPSAA